MARRGGGGAGVGCSVHRAVVCFCRTRSVSVCSRVRSRQHLWWELGHRSPSPGPRWVCAAPTLPGCCRNGRWRAQGKPRGTIGTTASASPANAAKGLLARRCLRPTHAAPSHLPADSELTRKSCLVSLCFLRLSLGHLNSLCDLSVMRPANPCFLPGPQEDANPHAVREVL